MSTHASISVYDEDNDKVWTIPIHFDGYPDHMGRVLPMIAPTQEMAAELVADGDIDSISNLCIILHEKDNDTKAWGGPDTCSKDWPTARAYHDYCHFHYFFNART